MNAVADPSGPEPTCTAGVGGSAGSDTYVPVSCVEHERLEFAVLRRQRLVLRFRAGTGEEVRLTVLPLDVATRDGAEWLSYRADDGAQDVLRLDRILSATPA